MRPLSLVTLSVLVLAPRLFLCYELVRVLGWPEFLVRVFEPWVPSVMALVTALVGLFLPWILGLFSDREDRL